MTELHEYIKILIKLFHQEEDVQEDLLLSEEQPEETLDVIWFM
jgi:hypothetical protein